MNKRSVFLTLWPEFKIQWKFILELASRFEMCLLRFFHAPESFSTSFHLFSLTLFVNNPHSPNLICAFSPTKLFWFCRFHVENFLFSTTSPLDGEKFVFRLLEVTLDRLTLPSHRYTFHSPLEVITNNFSVFISLDFFLSSSVRIFFRKLKQRHTRTFHSYSASCLVIETEKCKISPIGFDSLWNRLWGVKSVGKSLTEE